MSELAGKRALVTGASRGIGAAIAVMLAKKGADVAITYESSADKAGHVVSEIERKGRKSLAIRADSADPEAVKRAVEETVAGLGGLDILVNNAGIARYASVGDDGSLADLDAMFNVNVRSAVVASGAAMQHLGEGGRIVMIGSFLAERVPFPGVTLYSTTKSALSAFSRGLARDLGSRAITVNLVQPGPTDTDLNPANGDHADGLRALTALGHYGEPGDIASAVAFLVSPAAKFITGTVLNVDGGISA
ncbi:3-oxoacyl-ACP reductase FabG [Agrobacterium sp. Ap1]|uniref:3-oxoacyl-ACP reductase family protein n=1 Tax=Agrobacterium sp. Ap1 TaxID=2815337 RepID=UPI001A8C270E|nr:3-oxoacyl-ACP reductase family protein [Agrobacterium sp. Ap1]MBO0144791.1 3-oxoacyl-ACP reductase FabG [Agrobacterium sp. Ap1]